MAKKMSKGGKRILSIIFHLVVLVMLVTAYDTGRAILKDKDGKEATSEKSKKDGKTTQKSTGKQMKGKLTETKGKMEERGTSMEDLMAEKQRREKEKAAEQKKMRNE